MAERVGGFGGDKSYLGEIIERPAMISGQDEISELLARISGLEGSHAEFANRIYNVETELTHVPSEVGPTIEQLQGQVGMIEQACRTYQEAIMNMSARLDALARQTMVINVRAQALDLAIRAKASTDPFPKLVEHARVAVAFLMEVPPGTSANGAIPDNSDGNKTPETAH